VRPPLQRRPGEAIFEQVYSSFQHDVSAIPTLQHFGYNNVLWGSDYPHLEGTFPNTQEVLQHLFDGVPDAVRQRVTLGAFEDLFGVKMPAALAA